MSSAFGSLVSASAAKQRQQKEKPSDNDGDNQHVPGSTGTAEKEIDPLDAFMAGLDQELQSEKTKPIAAKPDRYELVSEDPLEVYAKQPAPPLSENHIGLSEEEERERRANSEVPLVTAVDHSSIEYAPFRRDVWKVHEQIASMTVQQISQARHQIGVQIHTPPPLASDLTSSGGYCDRGVAAPALSFAHFGVGERLLDSAVEAGFTQPTPIQAQAIPVALSGRDLIGVADTGSGKTTAFLWPLIVHLQARSRRASGIGPLALILAPTRELATQIYSETKKNVKAVMKRVPKHQRWTVVPLFGGMNMYEQKEALAAGCDIVVATPGRLLDHLRKGNASMRDCSFVVVDEADRLLAMGFEQQARTILQQVRPNRQTLLFSATFKRRVEALARTLLKRPVRISVGTIGASSSNLTQRFEVLRDESARREWLLSHLPAFYGRGQTLVFAGTRKHCDELASIIAQQLQLKCGVLHGEKLQHERIEILKEFKNGSLRVLVSSDVAARGLDIAGLSTVVSYELARDLDSHVHRIGRVGRRGQKHEGTAYTLLSIDQQHKEIRSLPLVLNSAVKSGQHLSEAVVSFANRLFPGEVNLDQRVEQKAGGTKRSRWGAPKTSSVRASSGGSAGGFVQKGGIGSGYGGGAGSSVGAGSGPYSRQAFHNAFRRASDTTEKRARTQ